MTQGLRQSLGLANVDLAPHVFGELDPSFAIRAGGGSGRGGLLAVPTQACDGPAQGSRTKHSPSRVYHVPYTSLAFVSHAFSRSAWLGWR